MKYRRLLESMEKKVKGDVPFRRYNLSDIISESYRAYYECEKDSNIQKLAESHLSDVRNNPKDIDRLSHQLCTLKYLVSMVESNQIKDEELLVPEEKYAKVIPDEKVEESVHDEDVEEKDDENLLDESSHDEDVEEKDDEDLLDESSHDEDVEEKEDEDLLETDLTDEEVKELAKHLESIRRAKAPVKESKKGIRVFNKRMAESKSYSSLDLAEFSKKSSTKAFYKTFKKMNDSLKEGKVLTRQESINLYKAANSAMTQLSVELEHNPNFLETFKECTSLLSVDVDSLLESMKKCKSPNKTTMRSLAKFTEALLSESLKNAKSEEEKKKIEAEIDKLSDEADYADDHNNPGTAVSLRKKIEDLNEADEDEELEDEIPVEDDEFVPEEDEEIIPEEEASEEVEQFDQEYADARVELHKEMAEEHAEDESPEVKEKLVQDAEEVMDLPGISEEQAAEIAAEIAEVEYAPEEGEVEATEEEEEVIEDESDISDDELAELKNYLKEMRKVKKTLKENAKVGDTIVVTRDEDYYTSHGYKINDKGYQVTGVENYGVFVKGYKYLIPHSDYRILNSK